MGHLYHGYVKKPEGKWIPFVQFVHFTQVYLRGSQIRYFILPDMLWHAPMFKKKALDRFRDRKDRTFQNPGGPQGPPKIHLGMSQNWVPQ